MSADQTKVLDVAGLADFRLENHGSLNACLTGQWRIIRIHSAQQKSSRDTGGNSHPLRSRYFGNRHWRRAHDAANNAPHLSAGDPAGDAADYSGSGHGWRRSFVLFNHLDFWWNLGGRAEFAVNDIGLNLLHNFYWRGRGRRRWRGRRRRNQESHKLRLRQSFRENQRNEHEYYNYAHLNQHRDRGGKATLGLKSPTRLYKAVFKHKASPSYPNIRTLQTLDTDRCPFAPSFPGQFFRRKRLIQRPQNRLGSLSTTNFQPTQDVYHATLNPAIGSFTCHGRQAWPLAAFPFRSASPDRPPESARRWQSTNMSQLRCRLPARG